MIPAIAPGLFSPFPPVVACVVLLAQSSQGCHGGQTRAGALSLMDGVDPVQEKKRNVEKSTTVMPPVEKSPRTRGRPPGSRARRASRLEPTCGNPDGPGQQKIQGVLIWGR